MRIYDLYDMWYNWHVDSPVMVQTREGFWFCFKNYADMPKSVKILVCYGFMTSGDIIYLSTQISREYMLKRLTNTGLQE